MATTDTTRADALIAKYIEPHPAKPGRAFARVKMRGVPVWALVAFLADDFSNADEVANDYAIPREAVDAAIAYYQQSKAYIDAFLLLNRGE
ncbi:MAG: DUF433 domain-containing protein [Thermomicrobiales bacterium]